MSKDSCDAVDCCPTCGKDAADDLDAKAAAVNLNSNGHLVVRCEKCSTLFMASPEVVWITERISEH